jgi:hypothetical protein
VSSNPTSTTSNVRAPRRSPLHTRRGRAGLAVLLAALPLLAACSAGSNPEVYNIIPDNGEGKSGYMYISNVWVVYDQNSGNAEIIGQVANTDPNKTDVNQLTGVSISGAAATIVPPTDTANLAPGVSVSAGSVNIPGLKSVQFGQPGQPELELAGADLTIGSNTNVTYTFSNGAPVTVTAIVEPNSGQWANYNPNGQNSASASPSGSATGTGTVSPTGTATGTAKATGTASPNVSDTASGTPSGAASGTTASPSSTH